SIGDRAARPRRGRAHRVRPPDPLGLRTLAALERAVVRAHRPAGRLALGPAQSQPVGALARPGPGRQPVASLPALAGTRLRRHPSRVGGDPQRRAHHRGPARARDDARIRVLPGAHRRSDPRALIAAAIAAGLAAYAILVTIGVGLEGRAIRHGVIGPDGTLRAALAVLLAVTTGAFSPIVGIVRVVPEGQRRFSGKKGSGRSSVRVVTLRFPAVVASTTRTLG